MSEGLFCSVKILSEEHFQVLKDAHIKYLWVSGKGCNNQNIWDWLPDNIKSLLFKNYFWVERSTFLLVSKEFARHVIKHWIPNSGQYLTSFLKCCVERRLGRNKVDLYKLFGYRIS